MVDVLLCIEERPGNMSHMQGEPSAFRAKISLNDNQAAEEELKKELRWVNNYCLVWLFKLKILYEYFIASSIRNQLVMRVCVCVM